VWLATPKTAPVPAVTAADGTKGSIQEAKPAKQNKILRRNEQGLISISERIQLLVLDDGITTVGSGVRFSARTLQSVQTTCVNHSAPYLNGIPRVLPPLGTQYKAHLPSRSE
jgi:hypothetical protein